MSGIANRLRISPANVMRPNTLAAIGTSASSAQMVAATTATHARNNARIARPPKLPRSFTATFDRRGVPARIPSGAPNDRRNPGSRIDTGDSATVNNAATARAFSDGPRWSITRAARKITAAVTARCTEADGPVICA